MSLPKDFNLEHILITFSGYYDKDAETPCAGIADIVGRMHKMA